MAYAVTLSAYDADSGAMVWRFYTVPGNPELGFENAAMEMAAKTWNGKWWELRWRRGHRLGRHGL